MTNAFPKIFLTAAQWRALPDYSTTLPTGTTEGKMWRRADHPRFNRVSDAWHMGRFGKPYHAGHRFAGQIPIIWRQIVIVDAPRTWPSEVRVPLRQIAR